MAVLDDKGATEARQFAVLDGVTSRRQAEKQVVAGGDAATITTSEHGACAALQEATVLASDEIGSPGLTFQPFVNMGESDGCVEAAVVRQEELAEQYRIVDDADLPNRRRVSPLARCHHLPTISIATTVSSTAH